MCANELTAEQVAEFPTEPGLIQACSLRVTDRVLGEYFGQPIRDEWECARCGTTWIGWPGNGLLCPVLTDGRRVTP